jgi:hypothetical protein
MALLVVLLQVMVGDWPLFPGLEGKGLTVVTVPHLLVPVGIVLLMVDKRLHVLVLVGSHMLLLVSTRLRLLILVLGLLVVCDTL